MVLQSAELEVDTSCPSPSGIEAESTTEDVAQQASADLCDVVDTRQTVVQPVVETCSVGVQCDFGAGTNWSDSEEDDSTEDDMDRSWN